MVQHNNVQPPSSSTPGVGGHSPGGRRKCGRLLSYPPIVGEAELFHPRPRMGVGVNGLACELEIIILGWRMDYLLSDFGHSNWNR